MESDCEADNESSGSSQEAAGVISTFSLLTVKTEEECVALVSKEDVNLAIVRDTNTNESVLHIAVKRGEKCFFCYSCNRGHLNQMFAKTGFQISNTSHSLY